MIRTWPPVSSRTCAPKATRSSTAGDGEQALEWLRTNACELIVLDVMLPGMDGFAVCRTLREHGNNTPVLFLTARGDPADRVRGLEAGGDDYLAKPFHLQEFLLRVRAILRRWDWYRSASATAATARPELRRQ